MLRAVLHAGSQSWSLCSSSAVQEPRGNCLSHPYLGMADELWQLMPEQPVKETACNEEAAAWETDAIISQIKLFPRSALDYQLWQAEYICQGQSHGCLFWDQFLFVLQTEGIGGKVYVKFTLTLRLAGRPWLCVWTQMVMTQPPNTVRIVGLVL